MNIRSIKFRGAMNELDLVAKRHMKELSRLMQEHQFDQLNTPRFDQFVEQADKLVHELEELRLALVDLTVKARKTAIVGAEVRV